MAWPFSGSSGFRSKNDSNVIDRGRANLLRSKIESDPGLDEESRVELIEYIDKSKKRGGSLAKSAFSEANERFAAAREGLEPKYAARRLFSERRSSLLTQPGRAQTVLSR